jgi:hypothetical protein
MSIESSHKKARMDDDPEIPEIVEDMEPVKIVSYFKIH